MLVIKPYRTAVSLFCRDGRVWHYSSLKDAREQLGLSWISNNVAAEFRVYSHTAWFKTEGHPSSIGWRFPTEGEYYGEPVYREANFVMRDDFGQPVTCATFEEERAKRTLNKLHVYLARYDLWNGEGPVPGTRKRRGGNHYRRHVRHANAKRAAETFVEEGEVEPRVRRKAKHLPDPRDGYVVWSRRNHNWKQFRKTRWKPD